MCRQMSPASSLVRVQAVWDDALDSAVAKARTLSLEEFATVSCTPGSPDGTDVKTEYTSVDDYPRVAHVRPPAATACGSVRPSAAMCRHLPPPQRMGYIDDVKARVPRTAYRGVVTIKHRGCRKLVVPSDFRPGALAI